MKLIYLIQKYTSQFIKFSFVGVSNTIISLGIYYLLIGLKVHYMIAYTAGFLVSVCNAFYWNNKIVFTNKNEDSLLKAFLKVFSSYGISFLMSIVLISILVELCGIPSYIAPILKMAITVPLNYILNKFWAFKEHF